MLQSGNHGRENNNQITAGNVSGMAPQPSSRGFTAPSSIPVKKGPSIKDVIGEPKSSPEPAKEADQDQPVEPGNPVESNLPEPKTIAGEVNLEEIRKEPVVEEDTEPVKEDPEEEPGLPEYAQPEAVLEEIFETEDPEEEDFEGDTEMHSLPKSTGFESVSSEEKVESVPAEESQPTGIEKLWTDMLEVVFEKVPTILFPLKNHVPLIEEANMRVRVKNEIQKEHFLMQKKEVLDYFQKNNVDVNEIIVEVDANLEGKKIIYDAKDKLENLKEHNPELVDFMQILKLKISD